MTIRLFLRKVNEDRCLINTANTPSFMIIFTFTFSRIVTTRNRHNTSKKYTESPSMHGKKTPHSDKGMMMSLIDL